MMFDCGLQNIFRLKNGQSRSINWENRNGEKGKGGMASSDLGPSRKGSPCIPKIEAGETVTLGEIQGEGMIQHIWITVTDRTSERNRYVLRDLVLRMYWDDVEFHLTFSVPFAELEQKIISAVPGALQHSKMAKPLKISTVLRILAILTTLATIPSFIMITTMMIRCHNAASTAGTFLILSFLRRTLR